MVFRSSFKDFEGVSFVHFLAESMMRIVGFLYSHVTVLRSRVK